MKCPDCEEELTEVVVEAFVHKTFVIADKQLNAKDNSGWEYNDHAYHCPHCDSLNIDQELRDYDINITQPVLF